MHGFVETVLLSCPERPFRYRRTGTQQANDEADLLTRSALPVIGQSQSVDVPSRRRRATSEPASGCAARLRVGAAGQH